MPFDETTTELFLPATVSEILAREAVSSVFFSSIVLALSSVVEVVLLLLLPLLVILDTFLSFIAANSTLDEDEVLLLLASNFLDEIPPPPILGEVRPQTPSLGNTAVLPPNLEARELVREPLSLRVGAPEAVEVVRELLRSPAVVGVETVAATLTDKEVEFVRELIVLEGGEVVVTCVVLVVGLSPLW